MNKIKLISIVLLLAFTGVACDSDFLTVYPSDQLTTETAIIDVEGAYAALYGAYDGLQAQNSYGQLLFTLPDVKGGDMQPTGAGDSRTQPLYSFNNRTPDNGPSGIWTRTYNTLNRINSLIVAFDNGQVEDATQAEENTILGQAYALRALCHFDIVRLYGVPYAKDPSAWGAIIVDKPVPSADKPLRSTVEETYSFITTDLNTAIRLLEGNRERMDGYINYWAAKALLARVSLYKGDWDTAFDMSKDVIDSGIYSLIPTDGYVDSWNQAFTTESIFSVVNTADDNLTRESLSSISRPTEYGEIVVSTAWLDLMNEDPDDVRLKLIFDDKTEQPGWCMKYPGRDGNNFVTNLPLIRLSDVYLIGAEAALKKSSRDQTAANKYLNDIRLRANPDAQNVIATEEMVIRERRKELVHEGHRFYDVMRLGLTVERTGGRNFLNLGEVITLNWSDPYTVLPIPRVEINGNPNVQPNPGYIH